MCNTKGKNYYIRQIFSCIAFLCLSACAQGQETHFTFNKITVEDGLSSQTDNYYIFQDSENFVWISSTQGLNRFDGTTVITRLDTANIQSRFFEDKNGNIWFSAYNAIYNYQRKNNRFVPHYITGENDEPITANYQLLFCDTATHSLWTRISNQHKLYQYQPSNKSQVEYEVGSTSSKAQLYKMKNGTDLMLLDPMAKGIKIVYLPKNDPDIILGDYAVSSFYLEDDSTLWAGIDAGLIQYNLSNNKIEFIHYFKNNVLPAINGIADPGDSTLILSTPKNGLYFVNKKNGKILDRIYAYEDGKLSPFSNPVDRIYLDTNKNLWVSSTGNGIFFTNLNKGKIKRYLSNNDAKPDKDNRVRSLTEDSKGNLYCLTENNIEVIHLSDGSISQLEWPKDMPPLTTPFFIHCDKNENLWYCSNAGLYVLQKGQIGFKKVAAGSFPYIFQMTDSSLLVSSATSGLYKVNLENENFSLEKHFFSSLTTGAYTLTFEDSKGRLFFCKNQTSILIYDYRNNRLLDSIQFPGFVNGMVEDKKRSLIWLASSLGLHKIQMIKEDSFSLQKDTVFPVVATNGVLIDENDTLWISTNKGLFRYSPHVSPDSIKLRQYNIADGLQSLDFSFWAALKLLDGSLAFAGVNGINIINPSKIKDLQIQPNPTITYIEINNEAFPGYLVDAESGATNISQISKLVLEHNQNDLYLQIAPLEYSDPSNIQYFFEMTGNGKTTTWTKDNAFRYPNMQPGTYQLTYNTSNSDEAWFPKRQKQLEIMIKHPWWKTSWAYFLYFLATAGIIYGYYRYRIARVRKEEAFKREVAEYKQLAAETETAILRLQMNPHFIFNSMNSISSYIAKKDIETANDYLNRFARLMRMILKFAAKPFIIVSDEIDLLDQYLQTESMRFEKKFNYAFQMDAGFDPDEYQIPTMILQPFIENAIWHGLSNKKGEGKILIRFWTTENSLNCSIEDNGIGRKAAGLKKEKSPDYESRALSITTKRLELLQVKTGKQASFEIQDLLDDDHNPSGTRVLLRFPVF